MKTRTFLPIVIATLIIFLLPIVGYADFYSNRDCPNNGDGSSWSCAAGAGQAGAFNNIPNANDSCTFNGYRWTKGSTYWLAGSDTEYSSTCIRVNSGSGTITIKKASPASHGTETGWDTAYGTKQAVITGRIQILTSNVTIDGSYRTSPEAGHGLKIQAAGSVPLISGVNNFVQSSITVKYVELTHTSFDSTSNHAITFYGNGGNIVQYCYIHDVSGLCVKGNGGFEGLMFEESVCGAIGKTTGALHCELMKDDGAGHDVIIRNNLFYDWKSTGGIVLGDGGAQDNWRIYNNVFTQRTAGLTCGNGVITLLTAQTPATNIKVFNNTFANISSLNAYVFSGGLGDMSGAGNEVKNNLFYNVATGISTCSGGCTKGTNWYSMTPNYTPSGTEIAGSGNPFVNSAAGNFILAAIVGPGNLGENLSSYFTTDKDGYSRLAGSMGWSIGAYRALPAPPAPPAPPARLRIF